MHDPATRTNPGQGVQVTRIDLTADRDTILPLESALGYSVSQHLFLGSGHHLAVEGSSDFVYLQRMTEYVVAHGGNGLSPKLSVIPVGGDGNMPAFVALLGRRLKVSALVDGARSSNKFSRLQAAAEANNVSPDGIVVCADVSPELPRNADIEDLFNIDDYLQLYNWALASSVTEARLPSTAEPLLRRLEVTFGAFDHALPAHALTEHRDVFFATIRPKTVERFTKLFELLNATVVG